MNLVGNLLIVISINMMLFFGQVAVSEINPDSTEFFNYKGSPLSTFDNGNYTINSNVTDKLPSTTSGVSPTTGNIFTDTVSTFKGWLLDTTGLNYVMIWFNALPNFLKAIHLPVAFAFGIGVLWHIYGILSLVLVLLGRNG